VVHDILIAVQAGIILLLVNVVTHSVALRVVPLHPLSVKYITVPVFKSTRETNSKIPFHAVGASVFTVMITTSHVFSIVPAAKVCAIFIKPKNPANKSIALITAYVQNIQNA
jgi:hypothetical protein